jgi:hypothetical protein
MMNKLTEYQHLWTKEADLHCLIRVGDKENEFVIFNRKNKSAIVIEDDKLYGEVIRMMISKGVQITNEIP